MRINTRELNRAPVRSHARPENNPPANFQFKRGNSAVVRLVVLIAFLALAVVGVNFLWKFIKKDYRDEVIADLRAIHTAQEIYRSQVSKYQSYGNFDDLVKANLIPASSITFVGCENCDENNLWVGKNRQFQFEIARNASSSAYCVAAISGSKSSRAFAVGQKGIIFEDDSDKISCVDSKPAQLEKNLK